jgi:hypothetical protein
VAVEVVVVVVILAILVVLAVKVARVKLSLYQAVEAHRIVRRRGSHIF